MSASKAAKQAGLSSLAEACRMTGKPANTLQNWHRDELELFSIVIDGCVSQKIAREAGMTASEGLENQEERLSGKRRK